MTAWHSLPFEECIEPVVYTAKVQRKDFLVNGAYPIVSQEESFINGFWDEGADLFTVDRPVVVFGDHTRALKYIDFDFVLGADGVKVLKPKPFLDPRFFYYQLHTAKLDSLGYARHYRLLKAHQVAHPSLPEQRRIVAILDEAFEAIATAKANTEKNLRNAFDLQSALVQECFEAHVDAAFKPAPLEDLCDLIVDCEHKTAPTEDSGFPSIRTPNIGRGKLILDNVNRVSEETYKAWTRRAVPISGDLILAREARQH